MIFDTVVLSFEASLTHKLHSGFILGLTITCQFEHKVRMPLHFMILLSYFMFKLTIVAVFALQLTGGLFGYSPSCFL
jgi:hypothetical protein